MSARNDITGDSLVSRKTNDAFREGWERIFGKKDQPQEAEKEQEEKKEEEK